MQYGKRNMRGALINRAIKAVAFVSAARFFTIEDLADALEIDKTNARLWLRELSIALPIVEVREFKRGGHAIPALYKLKKEED